jgi:hypothetical protein
MEGIGFRKTEGNDTGLAQFVGEWVAIGLLNGGGSEAGRVVDVNYEFVVLNPYTAVTHDTGKPRFAVVHTEKPLLVHKQLVGTVRPITEAEAEGYCKYRNQRFEEGNKQDGKS